jgi:hypothetical protein
MRGRLNFRAGQGLELAAAFTLLFAGCRGATSDPAPDPELEDRCPEPHGEFGPTDCAIVHGIVRSETGQPLANVPIRVDSVIRLVAYVYASNTATTAADGSFRLEVSRASRVKPPTVPDTATVELKTYGTPNPKAGETPTARAPVLMYFAELGQPVKPTVVDVVFIPYQ